MEKFSVLMSVYKNEKAEYMKLALESIYTEQILKPNEIVLVQDGPLTKELYELINKYKEKYKGILKIVSLKKNMGLGNALNIGLKKCSYEIVARMDTDDIAFPERFEKQIPYISKNKELGVLGSSLLEFEGTKDNILAEKKAPIKNIDKYIKFRNPINHPTVVFRKSEVLAVGSYKEINLFEDYYLWARMYMNNSKIENLGDVLLYFRSSIETYERRGGWKYVRAECSLQKEFFKINLINLSEYIRNIIIRNLGKIVPNRIRKIIYLELLR
ncbi:glycosyltransferase [Psychrilyobacter atlanticus]|uniref:glycosyltransferase n=1 Tax=Psychrilyobacter atlanticus TaxID=271091 RepID=UPI0004106108|nr:glycosyltransferase [Psychrilyobacter atlanticus]